VLARLLERVRYIAVIPVIGLTLAALATFGWGVERTLSFIDTLIDDPDGGKLILLELLRVVDVYLLGTVLLVFAVGLYELFVGDLELPAWLEIADLDGLKTKLIDVLVILLGLSILETIAEAADKGTDVLWKAAAASGGIATLTLFRVIKTSKPTGR